MANEMEKKLKRALERLDKVSQEFKMKKASFEDTCRLDALKELIKEQVPNEVTLHSAREAR